MTDLLSTKGLPVKSIDVLDDTFINILNLLNVAQYLDTDGMNCAAALSGMYVKSSCFQKS